MPFENEFYVSGLLEIHPFGEFYVSGLLEIHPFSEFYVSGLLEIHPFGEYIRGNYFCWISLKYFVCGRLKLSATKFP